MKLIEDDGEVIQSLADSTALLIVEAGDKPWALLERVRGRVAVTPQNQLVAAIVDYLNIPGNTDHIIASSLPRKRSGNHRHN